LLKLPLPLRPQPQLLKLGVQSGGALVELLTLGLVEVPLPLQAGRLQPGALEGLPALSQLALPAPHLLLYRFRV
jgi:hypothetical protein